MGLDLAGIAVRGQLDVVARAFEKCLAQHRIRVVDAGDADPYLNVRSAAGWTMLQFRGRLMPRVALALSEELRAEIVCLDVFERYNYEHVSWIIKGRPKLVYTVNQAEVVERFVRSSELLLKKGYARTQRRFPQSVKASLERLQSGGGQDDAALHELERMVLFEFFYESIAPIDVRAFALEAYEDPNRQFTLRGRVDALSMNPDKEQFFSASAGSGS
ncbi:MAG: hypothetical protein U0271_12500 [Polyangiaceae bacterium]